MDKHQVARILDEIGTILELQGENTFRCLAYHNAARAIEQLEEDLHTVVAACRLSSIHGIGETLQEKITVLVQSGSLPFYEELREKTPPGLVEMLRLPGVGPKKVKAIYDQLGIENLEALRLACLAGRVAGLKGFGEKTQQKLLEGIEFLRRIGQRVRLDEALAVAQTLVAGLRDCAAIQRLEVCGSLRRRKETIQDIDLLVSSDRAATVMERFVSLPGVIRVVARGDTKSSVMLNYSVGRGHRSVLNADLRVVHDYQYPFALHYFTGSKEHNVALRARAQEQGLKLNEYQLAGPGGDVPCREEADIFRALGLDYIPPELRENTGEINAAAEHRLPALVEMTDLRGTFHCHTNWSDGSASVSEMAQAAQSLGLEYLGIADHSQSLAIAYGLSPERVREQHAEIDRVSAALPGIRLFKGTECDILPDGRLDFDEETLATFDYVVASVHSHFNRNEEEMTARIIRAIEHPRVTMLGHATGRLLLQRDGYRVDVEAVLKAAAQHGTFIEINADPRRLDLDWIHCKRAKALSVQCVINPDAHSMKGIANLRFGVDVARRAWLEKKDILNTAEAGAVAEQFAAKHALGYSKQNDHLK
jgi:DNA polymerase (family 10)